MQSNYHSHIEAIKRVAKAASEGLSVEFMMIQRKEDDQSVWHECKMKIIK